MDLNKQKLETLSEFTAHQKSNETKKEEKKEKKKERKKEKKERREQRKDKYAKSAKGRAPQPSITFSCQARGGGGGRGPVGGSVGGGGEGVLHDNDNDDTYMTPLGRFDLQSRSA